MAATAIHQPKPTEEVKVVTAATKTEHYKCVRCEGSGYTRYLVKEQLDMIWKLQYDYEKIYLENHEMTVKLRSMNEEMEEFLHNIPLGNILPGDEKACDVEDKSLPDSHAEVKFEERKEDKHATWKLKEMKIQFQVIQQQKKLISDLMKIHPRVPKVLWGHHSRTWPRSSRRKPPSRSSQKTSKPTSSQKSRGFSIPFCPKPLHLLARKAYLKPPPKLPPLSTPFTSNADQATTSTLPIKCSSLECDENANGGWAMELFADALERAINSEEAAHPYYDGLDQDDDDPVTPWADHPYYDDLGVSVADQDDDHVSPWADHPFYDDLEISEAVQGDEELDSPGHEESPGDGVASDDDATEEVAWEEHPYYNTPDEGETNTESAASDAGDAWQDYSTEKEDEVPWEDSPYY